MSIWQPGPRPEWVQALNDNCDPDWIPLDADALPSEARAKTGLEDFGDPRFEQPFRILVESLNDERSLHTIGALPIRGDLLNASRSVSADGGTPGAPGGHRRIDRSPRLHRRSPPHGDLHHPRATRRRSAPPRPSPLGDRYPFPAPETATYWTDPRIAQADHQIRLWCEIVPEYDQNHELGGAIPVEDIQVMGGSFISDEWMGDTSSPRIPPGMTRDRVPGFEFHKQMLQHLQWRCPGERWVLKSPITWVSSRRC